MSKTYKMMATVFVKVEKDMPCKSQQYKSVGTKAQVMKDLKSVVDQHDNADLMSINVTLTTKEK